MGRSFLLLTGALLVAAGCAAPSQTATPPSERPYPGALPFSPDEMRAALILILPPGRVEEDVREMYSPGRRDIISVSDGILLLLASVSEDAARRVVEHEPRLRREVEEVRADPAAFRYRVMHAAGPSR